MKTNTKNIQRTSRRLRLLLQIIFSSVPIVNGIFWLSINVFPAEVQHNILPHFIRLPLPATTRLMGFVITMIPAAVAMAGLHSLVRLFRLYEKGEIFQMANVLCFKNMSRVLFWWFFATIIHRPLLTIVLTLHHPPGQRMVSIDLSSTDLTALLLGTILAVISWVMEEGRKLQEEQDLTV